MDLGRPYSSVSPTLEGDVLAVLARTSGPLTGRAVARLAARGSQSGINRAPERPALAEALRAEEVTLVGPDVATLLEQA